MSKLFLKSCPKCNGAMYMNTDQDLGCVDCGKVVYLHIRRGNDTRTGERRDTKTTESWTNMDGDSPKTKGKIWPRRSSDDRSTLSRQMGILRQIFFRD